MRGIGRGRWVAKFGYLREANEMPRMARRWGGRTRQGGKKPKSAGREQPNTAALFETDETDDEGNGVDVFIWKLEGVVLLII